MLAYLANTLIFLIVGVVITKEAIHNIEGNDWVLMITLYCALNAIRFVLHYYLNQKYSEAYSVSIDKGYTDHSVIAIV